MLRKPEISAGLMGHLARMQTLPYLYLIFVPKACLLGLFSGERIYGRGLLSEEIIHFKMGWVCLLNPVRCVYKKGLGDNQDCLRSGYCMSLKNLRTMEKAD